jgi:hypothetical protein
MWEPGRRTTVWACTVCYRDSFTFFMYVIQAVRQTTLETDCGTGDLRDPTLSAERFNEQAAGSGNENTPNQNSVLTSLLYRRIVDLAETVSTLNEPNSELKI